MNRKGAKSAKNGTQRKNRKKLKQSNCGTGGTEPQTTREKGKGKEEKAEWGAAQSLILSVEIRRIRRIRVPLRLFMVLGLRFSLRAFLCALCDFAVKGFPFTEKARRRQENRPLSGASLHFYSGGAIMSRFINRYRRGF